MDRRDFLMLFAIGAAGLYIPKTSYFFMPRTQLRNVQVPMSRPLEALWHPPDGGFLLPAEFDSMLVKVVVEVRTGIIQSFQMPAHLIGDIGMESRTLNHLIGRKISG